MLENNRLNTEKLEIMRGLLATKTGGEQGDKNSQKQQQLVMEEKIESLIIALQVFCFKQNTSIKDFVNVVHQFRSTVNSLGVELKSLPSYVKQLEGTG
jgi:hypothetical protein